MELTVLGKYGPYPKAGEGAASGYLLREGNTSLVMDMGAGTLARLQSVIDIRDIDGIYISHLHYDHTSDLLPFRYLLEDMKKTVTIYTHREQSEWYDILFSHPNFNLVDIDAQSEITLGEMRLTFFEMKHTVTDFAVRAEGTKTLVYTGDTVYTPELENAIRGADCVLADCSKPAGFTGPHMTADKTIEIYERTGIRILATHLSPGYSPDKEFAPYKGIEIVEEMKSYII